MAELKKGSEPEAVENLLDEFTIFGQPLTDIRLQLKGCDNTGTFYNDLQMRHTYVDTHRDISLQGDSIGLHSHSFYEILYCVDGHVNYLLGSERYAIQPGDILMIAPGTSHQPLFQDDFCPPYNRIVVWVNPQLIHTLQKNMPNVFPPQIGFLRTQDTKWAVLGEYFEHGCTESAAHAPGWELFVLGNTISILALLQRILEEERISFSAIEKRTLLDDIILYIDDHLAEKITLASTAHHFLVSESTISKIFRTRINVSFYRYVTQRRLITAKNMMGAGIPLDLVSQKVGFGDYSSFYRAFKQEYGISPNEYRSLFLY